MILYQKENSVHSYHLDVLFYDNFHYIPHLHRDFEVVYVIEGQIVVTVEGESFSLSAGEACVILRNQVHSFETPDSSKAWVCVFADDYVRDFSSLVGHAVCKDHRLLLNEEDRRFLEKNLIFASPDRLTYVSLLSYLCALFYRGRVFHRGGARDDRLFHKILEYISLHFTENLTQKEMAKALGYEPHYLSRYFNRFFGKGFKQLLNEYRVNFAKEMMAAGEKSLSRVALESGFQSIRNFNRVYQSLEKEEPRQTQKRLTGE